ncbi:MAG: TlpA family protein disulfide reductase [Deltaproteobacteria bacterium]|nr:TlpA family protein disulfide reductase [Deltaproteobacteria bacterium]
MKKQVALFAMILFCTSALAIKPFSLPWKNNPQPDAIYNMADHPNGIFVMEFFANFCGPCNMNAANVDELAYDYKDEARVQVLDTALDSDENEIKTWIAKHNPNHPVVKDVNREIWRQVGGQYIPTMIVTDCHGTIQFQYTGTWGESIKQQIRSVIDGLLQENCE